jgi:Domain of unknown function (DUF4367)
MNDDFLTKFQKPPRPQFAASLLERINQPMNTTTKPSRLRPALPAFTAVAAALTLALAVSPSAQAAIGEWIQEIGGVNFVADNGQMSGEEEPVTVTDSMVSLNDPAALPFAVSLPAWAPDGFVLDTNARITDFGSGYTPITIAYWGEAPGGWPAVIYLSIGQNTRSWIVDLEHVEEVQINGQPAALTRGGWNADTGQWNVAEGGLTLTWTRGDLQYQLMASNVSAETLIQMAESIP